MASLHIPLRTGEEWTRVNRRTTDDLPVYIKGTAKWEPTIPTNPGGYYITLHQGTPEEEDVSVEFINNSWYFLRPHNQGLHVTYWTRADHQITNENLGLVVNTLQSNLPSTTSTSTTSVPTVPVTVTPADLSPDNSTTPSTSLTTVPVTPPTTMALQGTPPAIFDGTRSKSAAFLREFLRFKRLNHAAPVMTEPYTRVILALSYMKGPLVDDWVAMQEDDLDQTTSRALNPIDKTDEVLWTTFATGFTDVWKDSGKEANAYDQLMKLEMKDYEADTYITTFERLAKDAEWEPDAKGTIARFKAGIKEHLHRRILNRDTRPKTMADWKKALRDEVERMREVRNAGFTSSRFPQGRPTQGLFQATRQPPSRSSTSGVVPMDVDATTIKAWIPGGPPFKKLTEEERVLCMKEGRCLRCRKQGHMARQCPLNLRQEPVAPNRIRAADTADTTDTTNKPTTMPPQGRTKAQMIADLENSMTEEERGAYLDARDMDSGFCNAKL